MQGSAFPATRESRRSARLLAAAALCVYLSTAGGGLTSIDAVMTYEVTKNLVLHASSSFDVEGLNHHRGVDGRYYSPFGIGQSIFNIPFYLAGHAVRERLGLRLGRSETVDKAAVALGSAVAAAGLVWVTYLFAWALTGSSVGALRTALALGFGTLVWPYSKFGFSAALTGWCLTAGIYSTWIGVRLDRRRAVGWGGVWLACAFLTRHEMAIAAPIVATWIAFESKADWPRLADRLTWFGAPLAAAFAFWLWYNFTRFGHPFETGDLGPDVDLDQQFMLGRAILTGINGLLFSPGRSLFLYAPLTVAGIVGLWGLARRDRSTAMLFAGAIGTFLMLYGSLRYWDGLRGYGPRYLVPVLPLLIIPLAWWLEPGNSRWRVGLRWLVAFSVVVQLAGVVVDFSKVSIAHARAVGDYSRDAKIYSWPESGLVLDARAALALTPENARLLLRGERPPAPTVPPGEDDRDFSQRLDFSLDFWWLYLFYLGVISAPLALLFGMAPLGVAWLLLKLTARHSLDEGIAPS